MLKSLISVITKVPHARSEAERIKFETFRIIIFWFGIFISGAVLMLTVSWSYSDAPERPEDFHMRITWTAATICYFTTWALLGTKIYRLSIWIFALAMGAIANNVYHAVGTDATMYRSLIFLVLTLLILSVYLPKRQLYLVGLIYYAGYMFNIYLHNGINVPRMLGLSVVFSFATAALELVMRLRAAEAKILELERARAVHSSRLSTLGETTAFLMHEVSSPLSVLNGHLELIQKHENVDYHVSKMQNALDRALDFINSVKRMVRASEPNQFEVVQLSEIFKMVSDLVETSLRRRNIRLEFDYSDDLEIKCRPAEIAQVLINLINNSADALKSADEKWIRVSSRRSGSFVEIEVVDPGSGIEVALKSKVMQPFFTTKPTGSGIGLSVAQEIALQHDGRLEIIKFKQPTTIRLRFAINPQFTRQKGLPKDKSRSSGELAQ